VGLNATRPDPQAERIYEMEAVEFSFIRKHRCSPRHLQELNRIFCEMAGVPAAKIRVIGPTRSDYAGQYDYKTGTIELDRHEGINGAVFAHELAHHIVFLTKPRAADHGPAFARCYGQLLDLMRLLPQVGFRAICRKHKVTIAR